jgi:methyl-accepting chemotaxis protein
MLLTLQDVQGWVGPTMAVSLVVIALSFLVIAGAVLFGALAVARQAKKLREHMGSFEEDARRAMKSVRRATRNTAEASQVLKEQAYHFAHTGKRVRARLEDVTALVHQRVDEMDALYEVVAGEVEEAALDVATSVRTLRHNPVMRVARRFLGVAAGR